MTNIVHGQYQTINVFHHYAILIDSATIALFNKVVLEISV